MRELIYPTFIFLLFLGAMGFLALYTYGGAASYDDGGRRGVLTKVENFQAELNKKIK